MKTVLAVALASFAALAQDAPAPAAPSIVIPAGTRIPLQLINRVSTKNAHEGDQVYLQSAYPIVVDSRIVIPPGSYVKGTITQSKRPGKISGRGELYLRFDSITLPNGVTRDFRGRVGAIDGSSSDTLDKKEGKVVSDGSKGHDAATVGTIGAAGASIGAVAARSATGAGVGAAGGILVGLATVLLTRGPDASLERGSTLDMVLDHEMTFKPEEVNFTNAPAGGMRVLPSGPGIQNPSNPVINPARVPR